MTQAPITKNTLFYGDNLPILREHIPDNSIDLIYLDPPFNSNRSYNVLFSDESGKEAESQITAFDDAWHWGETTQRTYEDLVHNSTEDVSNLINAIHELVHENQMMAYLVMMAARLIELRRVLKPTGSIYLHCDPTASHYLKVLMDAIFGFQNFRNEIIWRRTGAHGRAKRWGPIHDVLLFYSKTDDYTWNRVFQKYDDDYLEDFYRSEDKHGKYQSVSLDGPGVRTGPSGQPWKGVDPTTKGRHWELPPDRALPSWFAHPAGYPQMTVQERLDVLERSDLIYWPPTGHVPRFKRYLEVAEGNPVQDIIGDIRPIGAQAAERLGYPTQKPEALLKRIIEASSNPGDIVLDPFSGCGTAIAAAQQTGRRWIGIDITHLAIAMHKSRLKDMFNQEPGKDYEVIGEPEDLSDACQLALDSRYQFQWWALSLVQARPLGGQEDDKKGKKGSDKGIDGIIPFLEAGNKLQRVLVQVKSGHVNSGLIRDLHGTVDRENAAIGVFITLEPATGPMEQEAVAAGFYNSNLWQRDYRRVQILTIEDLLQGKTVQMPPTQAGAYKEAQKVKAAGGKQGEFELK